MPQTTLRIFIFIETNFRSEDLNHSLEHRFFENPAILALEDDSHTVISAYAHVTGILFKITTVKHSESEILKTFDVAFSGDIPNFSEKERKRFEQELKEREFDKEADLVESCPFRQEFETGTPAEIRRFSDVIARQSVCVWKNGTTAFMEKRFSASNPLPLMHRTKTSARGKEFHLITCHRVTGAEDSAYQTIWVEYVRNYLKAKCSRTREAYDIWTNAYNEA